jgi:hypothetical protein
VRALFTLTQRLWRAREVLVKVLFRAKSSVEPEYLKAMPQLSDWLVNYSDCRAISISKWTKCITDKVHRAQFKLAATHVDMLAPLSTRRLCCFNPHRRSSAARCLQWKSWHRDRIGPTGGGSGVSITDGSTKQSAYRPLPSKTCS